MLFSMVLQGYTRQAKVVWDCKYYLMRRYDNILLTALDPVTGLFYFK